MSATEGSSAREAEREAASRKQAGGEPVGQGTPGILDVVNAVRDQEFPAQREEMAERIGDREVHTSAQHAFPLREVLGKLKEEEFASIEEFQTALHRHWEGVKFMEIPEEQRPYHKSRGGGE